MPLPRAPEHQNEGGHRVEVASMVKWQSALWIPEDLGTRAVGCPQLRVVGPRAISNARMKGADDAADGRPRAAHRRKAWGRVHSAS